MSRNSNEVIEVDYSDVDLTDATHPKSIVNLLPSYIANFVKAVPEALHSLSEEDLKREGRCDIVESRLRQAFWMEYDRASFRNSKMNVASIYGGVCNKSYFREVCANSYKLAYVLRPPTNYKVALQELLTLGVEQLREILTTPNFDDQGKFNATLAGQKLKIMDTVFQRTIGAVVQKVEQKNLNVNVETEVKDVETQIAELENRIQQSQGRLIDVTSTKKED